MKVELATNLKRQATKILADLHISKEPVLTIEHGQANDSNLWLRSSALSQTF